MTAPAPTNDQPTALPDGGQPVGGRARRRLNAARVRYQGSWAQDIVTQLKGLDFINWITIFGAELLWSALPLIILLSSLANERIDDDLSRHIGLNSQGDHIVRGLFRNSPTHAVEPIVTGLIFTFAGSIAVVASLRVIYERLFDVEHRGWRDIPRFAVWGGGPARVLDCRGRRRQAGPQRGWPCGPRTGELRRGDDLLLVDDALLAGRTGAMALSDPAGPRHRASLARSRRFSSLYFSSVVVDDSRVYGTIGVDFTFLTWFILIGGVVVLGAAAGAVWQQRAGTSPRRTNSGAEPGRDIEGSDSERVPR